MWAYTEKPLEKIPRQKNPARSALKKPAEKSPQSKKPVAYINQKNPANQKIPPLNTYININYQLNKLTN